MSAAHTSTEDPGDARTIEDLLTAGRSVAMVMTMVDGEHTSRPVTVVEVLGSRISFLVSRVVDWVEAIADGHAAVHVTVADQEHNTYLSLEGVAAVVIDAADRERLWTPAAKGWFTGPHDPSLAVLRFDVSGGKWWDEPSGAVRRGLALLKAAVAGDSSETGTAGPVTTG